MAFSNRPYGEDGYGVVRKFFRPANNEFRTGKRATRQAPPESTSAENFYYVKQMNSKTPMVIVMTDGEQIRGRIEWYDRNCLKVNREGAPNLLIQKHCIKYVFKQEEETA